MKKLLCSCLALAFVLISLCGSVKVYADDSVNPEMEDAAELFIILRDSGKLFADENGYYMVADNDYENHPAYEHFLTVIDHCNAAIAAGVLEITQTNDVQLKESAIIDQDALMDLRAACEETVSVTSMPAYNESDHSTCGITNPNPELDDGGSGSAHSCLRMTFDMIGICEDNYQHLVSYHNSMLIAQMTNASLDPYVATASYWVSLVREDGAWDYKSSETYKPYTKPLCTYYDGEYHHVTSEYFGNFNYGYTGSFLFNLDILHAGSYAVAGFNPKDLDDWPAIDDGYYYKMG